VVMAAKLLRQGSCGKAHRQAFLTPQSKYGPPPIILQ
jgi:hypothetical protein